MRFFVFFYTFNTLTKTGNGSSWLTFENGFPSNKYICDTASNGQVFTSDEMALTGWNELSESDFNDFAKANDIQT